eukprot:6996179-Heterocapsa_arctica.AAC.1
MASSQPLRSFVINCEMGPSTRYSRAPRRPHAWPSTPHLAQTTSPACSASLPARRWLCVPWPPPVAVRVRDRTRAWEGKEM